MIESSVNLYGIVQFGDKYVQAEKIEFDADISKYNYLCIYDRRPDAYGNGSFDILLFDNERKPITFENGWTVNEIKGGWNWNEFQVYISITDQFGVKTQIELEYSTHNLFINKIILGVFKKLVVISKQYTSVLEYELTEGHNAIKLTKHLSMEMDKAKKVEITNTLNKYLEKYKQYIENPVYQSKASIANKDTIAKNLCRMMDILLNAVIQE